RRQKVKKDDLPKDSLIVYTLGSGNTVKIPDLISYKVPQKWGGWVAYQHMIASTESEEEKDKKSKKQQFTIQKLDTSVSYSFPEVTDYQLSEKGDKIAFVIEAKDSVFQQGVYVFDASLQKVSPVFRSKGKYHSLSWSKEGNRLAFVSDLDTTKALIRPYNLHLWSAGQDSALTAVAFNSKELGSDRLVSEHFSNQFSHDESKLFFGLKPYPILQDTSLLEEEIVNVEVWSYQDRRLYTQQKIDKERDLKKAYLAIYHIDQGKVVPIGDMSVPDVITNYNGNSPHLLGFTTAPYEMNRSWEGGPLSRDGYVINAADGTKKLIAKRVKGSMRMSPGGKYAYWYNYVDSACFTYQIATAEIKKVTDNKTVPFYRELHDTPSLPGAYGLINWTANDEKLLIYDRYDIWEVDPTAQDAPQRITPDGRGNKIVYRYQKLDDDEDFIIKGQEMLLKAMNERDKSMALYSLRYGKRNKVTKLYGGNYRFDLIKKAQAANRLMFTQENFREFPDIRTTDGGFRKIVRISNVNPQQADYRWGDITLHRWKAFDGTELEGMLVKPDGFDPNKQYPLLVNFYERSSDRLNVHRDPYPHRSTINYSFYTSRGYMIFNPNVVYKEGAPGESAYNCVISGIESLIDAGFVDKDRIGVQGHSWGGYQVAHLVTRTDLFACGEAGAPVPNMISAYGGIRWWTGLSRMFQYEQTQSRLGATLWENRNLYIENSPIFFLDKVNTPLLIMHNDADGHVPWYQGIELFVALRRLGKPAWFLNYQGEPHWPLKRQNRIDFNIRMQQYFDHYLLGSPMPRWMDEGVPATKMGIDPAFDLDR
ncbi:MAG: prolyl oligopeptidase family serine peptidase, partial [Bacteroidota bacterium]